MSMISEMLKKQEEERMAKEKKLGLEQKRMYATERENYLRLHMCRDITESLITDIKSRLDLAGCTAQVMLARDMLSEAMARIFYTIPHEQRATIERNADAVTYAIGVKTPGSIGARNGDSSWGMYLSFHDIHILVEAAKDHCITCMGTPQEQSACELRKAFDRMGVDADHVNGECGFRQLI